MSEIESSDQVAELDECPTCGAPRQGLYCHECGQRFPEGRLTLRGIWSQLPARIFNLDRGLLHTFLEMFKRPGEVPRDYVAGRRSPYVNPLTYFLVAATIQLLGLALSEQQMLNHMESQLSANGAGLARLQEVMGDDASAQLATLYMSVLKQGYTYLFLIFMAVPFAIFLRILCSGLKPSYNLAESLIFALYTSAHMVLITGLLVPLVTRINVGLQAGLSLVIYLVYTGIAARGFYDRAKGRVVLAMLSLALSFVTFVVCLTAIFLFALFLKISSMSGA